MHTNNDYLIEIKDLKTHFFTDDGVVKAVDGASFAIPRGKTTCIVGESGCGKSVMARSILQVVASPGRIVNGQILYHSEEDVELDLATLDPKGREIRGIRGKDITMIFQEPMSALSPLYTIGNQIIEIIRQHQDVSKKEAREMAIESLRKVGIPRPEERIDTYTFQLSGGMRQRAMIAMALVSEPKLLIADEPTTALDVTTQANILDLMRELQAEMGMTVMFITHDLGVVAEIAHEVVVMYLGTIVERGAVDEIFTEPKHPYTRALLRSIPKVYLDQDRSLDTIRGSVPHPLTRPEGCLFHDRCDFAVSGVCNTVRPDLIDLSESHKVNCLAYDPDYSISLQQEDLQPVIERKNGVSDKALSYKPLIEVNDLKMHFPITSGFFRRTVGHVKAVDGVSFSIHEGETLGLVGESGCGKTTLGHAIIRLYEPTSGEILYGNNGSRIDLAKLDQKEIKPFRTDMRMIFQDPYASLNPRMQVLDIVGEVLKVNNLAKGKELEDRVRYLLTRVGLSPHYLQRYPHAFSGGQRQRIGVARALASNPRLVIADEPVSALDVSVQAQIINLLKELQAEFGLTYLFISHDLNVVAHISDRVAVMYVGKIVELAPTRQIFENPQHPYTEALLSAVLTPDPKAKEDKSRIRLGGAVADPANPPPGCAFHPRCRYATEKCGAEVPALRKTVDGHLVSCHFAEELQLMGVSQTENQV